MLESKQRLSLFPPCNFRLGRIWDDDQGKYKAVMTCGGRREIDLNTCQICGGHTEPMLKTFTEPSKTDNS